MARIPNPFAFTRGPVTFIVTAVYVALIAVLIVVQTELPSSPSSSTPISGINLTEAWQDLQLLSAQHHPYNSRNNDFVHDWLLLRIQSILVENKASASSAYVFDDQSSNLTFSSPGSTSSPGGISVYFEGTNIVVYIRGEEDDDSEWFNKTKGQPSKRHGVLVNAHYDSVSTGYGATDDGVGVISILQLIRYFTTSGNQPAHGVVLLLNNGEEDFLNGARVFSQHPLSKFVASFLNLEGAGAGGRAALFRSTDAEVTRAYAQSPYPFGTVLSGDAFKRGLVRSQTDYVIFNGVLGYRGLDVAFIGPRARYHTNQDDSRHTGQKALWHMLSAAVATTKELSRPSGIDTDSESHGSVWFDMFGQAFVLMRTHTFFAISVTLLVVGPIILLLTLLALYQADKFYLFSGSRSIHTLEGDNPIPLYGWRGFFRFPLVLLFACAAPVALAYLMFKENEQIAHSSEWPVWCMMVSSFVSVAWFVSRIADFIRPSALTRAYGFAWLFTAWWVFLVVAVIFEQTVHLSGGYFVFFYTASIFLASWLSYLEMFSLPKKSQFCGTKLDEEGPASRPVSSYGRPQPVSTEEEGAIPHDADDDNDEEEVNETSSLLRKRGKGVLTKSRHNASHDDEEDDEDSKSAEKGDYDEQEWSKSMWTGSWLLQFLIVAPINVIILGQLGLYLVEALHQTGQDGSSMFLVYVSMAILTIFIFSPIVPLIHRLTWHIPVFLFFVLVGTLVYNLIAFPFSPQNRVKLFFQQELDLDQGNNTVSMVGVSPFLQEAIKSIPSAAGQHIACHKAETFSDRMKCFWEGPAPTIGDPHSKLPPERRYRTLVNFNSTLVVNGSESRTTRFVIYGKDTRACKLQFDSPISSFQVSGQAPIDKRFPPVPEAGSREIRLWSRTWDRAWTVDVTWEVEDKPEKHLDGKVVCLWSDANRRGAIPAFDEAEHYVPNWVAVTKAGDGLVEGYKKFRV